MNQAEVIARLQTIFDNLFLEPVVLTPARLRGIRESRADILVFGDDDNVLATDYLQRTLVVSTRPHDLKRQSTKLNEEH
jgi:hypothetical protein